MTVDVHTHVIPEPLLERARTLKGLFGVVEREGWLVHPEGFRAPLTADFHDASTIAARMERMGIEESIVSLSPTMFFYDRRPAEAAAFASAANDAVAELTASGPALLGVAHLPMQAPEVAAAELERAVTQLGLRGALIGTNVGAGWLDDDRFEVVLSSAEQLGVPLILHPYFVGPKPHVEPYFLTNSIGNPLDTCVAAARMIHAGTLDRHPALKLVLVHGGGFLPYQLGRLDHAHRVRSEARTTITEPPSTYLGRFWIDTIVHSHAALAFLAALVGHDRLLLGTDLPYDMADRDPVESARSAGLDPAALGANARELWRFDHRIATTEPAATKEPAC